MARKFNGTNQDLRVTTGLIQSYPFSIAAWFNQSGSTGADQWIFGCNQVNSLSRSVVGIAVLNASSLFTGVRSNTSGTFDVPTVGSAISTGRWYAGVFSCVSATNVRVYINNTSAASATNIVLTPGDAVNTFIGSYDNGQGWFSGSIADVAIWRSALSPNEALAFFLGTRPYLIRPNDLTGYWPCANNSSYEFDLSGRGRIMFPQASPTITANSPSPYRLLPQMPDYSYDSLNPPALIDGLNKLNLLPASQTIGPIHPHSVYLGGAGNNLFPNFYAGGGVNASPREEGIGVAASLTADSTAELHFRMPSSIPTPSPKLLLRFMANAVAGRARLIVSDATAGTGVSPSAATLVAGGVQQATWAGGDADKYKDVKLSLNCTPAANDIVVVAIKFLTSGWTLAQTLNCVAWIIWE